MQITDGAKKVSTVATLAGVIATMAGLLKQSMDSRALLEKQLLEQSQINQKIMQDQSMLWKYSASIDYTAQRAAYVTGIPTSQPNWVDVK